VLDVEVGDFVAGRGATKQGWRAVAVGDTCLLQLRPDHSGWRIVASFPLESSDEFESNPALVSSNTPKVATPRWASGLLEPADVLVGATDAVGQWMLRDGSDVATCVAWDEAALADMFTSLRMSQQMVKDDVTFVRLHVKRAAVA
jgi:hypothetical protein